MHVQSHSVFHVQETTRAKFCPFTLLSLYLNHVNRHLSRRGESSFGACAAIGPPADYVMATVVSTPGCIYRLLKQM